MCRFANVRPRLFLLCKLLELGGESPTAMCELSQAEASAYLCSSPPFYLCRRIPNPAPFGLSIQAETPGALSRESPCLVHSTRRPRLSQQASFVTAAQSEPPHTLDRQPASGRPTSEAQVFNRLRFLSVARHGRNRPKKSRTAAPHLLRCVC